MRKEVVLPLSDKAKQAVEKAQLEKGVLHLGDVNDVAGWDADHLFGNARAKLKVLSATPLHHTFSSENGKLVHLFFINEK